MGLGCGRSAGLEMNRPNHFNVAEVGRLCAMIDSARGMGFVGLEVESPRELNLVLSLFWSKVD